MANPNTPNVPEENVETLLTSGAETKVKQGISIILEKVKRGAMPIMMATSLLIQSGCGGKVTYDEQGIVQVDDDTDQGGEGGAPGVEQGGEGGEEAAENCSGYEYTGGAPGVEQGGEGGEEAAENCSGYEYTGGGQYQDPENCPGFAGPENCSGFGNPESCSGV